MWFSSYLLLWMKISILKQIVGRLHSLIMLGVMTYIAFDGVFKAIQIRDQVVDTKPLETRIVRLA